jgi:hypothetical protein
MQISFCLRKLENSEWFWLSPRLVEAGRVVHGLKVE